MGYDSYKRIPNVLRQYRNAKGLSQQQVALFLGLKNNTLISRWEQGESIPSFVNIMRLAALYGTTIDSLFGDLIDTAKKEVNGRAEELLRSITGQ